MTYWNARAATGWRQRLRDGWAGLEPFPVLTYQQALLLISLTLLWGMLLVAVTH